MTLAQHRNHLYSIIIAIQPDTVSNPLTPDWRVGEINVDWVDFTREKSLDKDMSVPVNPRASWSKKKNGAKLIPGAKSTPSRNAASKHPTPDSLSLQPLLAHFPGPNPLDSSVASGVTPVGRGVVHLFRHAPPPSLVSSLEAQSAGESSRASKEGGEWAGDRAEGEDGSLIAILAVPAWMRPADFLEFIGGWGTCLEGVRMIREATTPNRSIVLLKFRDPLQASDFLVIFTGRAFSTLDTRETCHPIRIHHLVLHKIDPTPPIAIPAFPPSVYARPDLLTGVPAPSRFELPSCPVCLERLDSTVTGLVTLPCAHTFDCDCLRKWGDSRCPVCRVSHLLLSSSTQAERGEVTRATKCSMCDWAENNWICVVCGVVGCGRYEPGKGHARRHWEESGHVLAMELETQRVWDYKGDNYVHRLIQTRNDGKLVELPSASSLVTPSVSRALPLSSITTPTRSPSTQTHANSNGNHTAGPSTNDLEKISTIESITLEYSYLLSSQLEAMRQHYASQSARLATLEAAEKRALEAERAKETAERRAEKASELSRSLQASLSAERAMSEGLSTRVKSLKEAGEAKEREGREKEKERREKEDEVKVLEETVRDLMFSLEAGVRIQAAGGAEGGVGGDLVVLPGEREKEEKRKKKGKK